ncbi:C39 family peptidase [Micromonospora sp. WMMA1363]|uniref:C39 family peptidase n=1 Tax=Micromonospora sp. WMMA1363 TaxID=3053985 RepID=UPI00259D192E|nr:C39 family peptidase [Micromonospora sp. WMMA1363]MDM4718283.1 C39 family peptidase [Micromonospora sp. WMMA1363]
MEDPVKHHLRRQLRRIVTERPYQVAAASAAALVLATGSGALAAGADESPAVGQTPASTAELGSEAVGSASTVAAAPSSAAPSSAAPSSAPVETAADPDLDQKPEPPTSKLLEYDYQAQTNFYYCGPAAVRNALSATGVERTQDQLAGPLGTDQFGTDSAEDTTRVLNAMVEGDPYQTRMFSGGAATPAQMDQLQSDIVAAVADGRGVVVNVAGSATDTDGGWHSFPGGHYVAVVGYDDEGRLARIADSANPAAGSYWMTTIALANWAATRGYSA